MRVLCYDAKIKVYLQTVSSMTPEEVAKEIVTEISMSADIPQPIDVIDYAIRDITLTFAGETTSVSDDEDDE